MNDLDLSQAPAETERNLAMGCHLLGLTGLILPPIGQILAPLLLWLLKREGKTFVDHQGKEAINFQITATLAFLLLGSLTLVIIGFVLLPIYALFWLVVVLRAAIKANSGHAYRYPLTLRLIK